MPLSAHIVLGKAKPAFQMLKDEKHLSIVRRRHSKMQHYFVHSSNFCAGRITACRPSVRLTLHQNRWIITAQIKPMHLGYFIAYRDRKVWGKLYTSDFPKEPSRLLKLASSMSIADSADTLEIIRLHAFVRESRTSFLPRPSYVITPSLTKQRPRAVPSQRRQKNLMSKDQLARPGGVEPPASRLEVSCSIQLS